MVATVTPTDERQVLEEELAEARALIERGEYERALDALTSLSEAARARHDAVGLNEVRLLAERVSERALARSDRQRADALRHDPAEEVHGAPARQPRLALRRWALIVVMVWLVLSVVLAALVAATSNPDGFISPGFYAVAVVVVLTAIALVIWLLGGLIIVLGRHVRRERVLIIVPLGVSALAGLVALGVALGSGGKTYRPSPSFQGRADVRVLSGWCKQNPSTSYIDTRVLVRNVGKKAYPDPKAIANTPLYEYHYNDGGDTYDEPEPDREATIPVGRTMWIHFQHFYNASQHDVDGCKVTFDYDTNYSLDVRS